MRRFFEKYEDLLIILSCFCFAADLFALVFIIGYNKYFCFSADTLNFIFKTGMILFVFFLFFPFFLTELNSKRDY